MTVEQLATQPYLEMKCNAKASRAISQVYCCDLLSIVMGRAPSGSAWVTVMGNVNSVAVAVLADVACIVLAEGIRPTPDMLNRAQVQEVPVLTTDLPIFEAAAMIDKLCHV